jgi:preprotein translocase subunit SecE
MAVEVAPPPGRAARLSNFYRDVVAEMKKVTWPDRKQVQQATIAIIAFVLFIGAIITLMDLVLRGLLVSLIPSLFAS